MSKYLIEFPKAQAAAIVDYNDAGILISLQFTPAGLSLEQIKTFFSKPPWSINALEYYRELAKSQNVRVTVIPEDLSFDRFWEEYNYKEGRKANCEKIWNLMPEAERSKALRHIAKYNQTLMNNPTMSRCYPQTYLNDKRWNN